MSGPNKHARPRNLGWNGTLAVVRFVDGLERGEQLLETLAAEGAKPFALACGLLVNTSEEEQMAICYVLQKELEARRG